MLPSKVYGELPLIVVGKEKNWIYQNLRVVALRVDPCFQETPGPCRRQIRLVWQPLERVEDSNGSWITLDASVHSFHELSEKEWQAFREKLFQLSQKFSLEKNLPLGIHPLLSQKGMNGIFAKKLKSIFLEALRSDQIVRTTVMTVNSEGTVWVFTGFDWQGEVAKRMDIPRVDKKGQAFFANLENPSEYRSQMNPYPEGEAPFLNLLFDSKSRDRLPKMEIVEAVRSAWKNLNPRFTNPGNRDCVSCHVSRALPLWYEKNVSNEQTLFQDLLFEGPGNLANTTVDPMRTQVLRAFGYFGRDPIISPRVVFETSLAIQAMDQ